MCKADERSKEKPLWIAGKGNKSRCPKVLSDGYESCNENSLISQLNSGFKLHRVIFVFFPVASSSYRLACC